MNRKIIKSLIKEKNVVELLEKANVIFISNKRKFFRKFRYKTLKSNAKNENESIQPSKEKFKSAKWYEWANNLWNAKKNALENNGLLKTSKSNIYKNIKILVHTNPKFKKLKQKWLKKSEKKLAELDIKTRDLEKDEKEEIIEGFKNRLAEEMDDLFQNWIIERKKQNLKILKGVFK